MYPAVCFAESEHKLCTVHVITLYLSLRSQRDILHMASISKLKSGRWHAQVRKRGVYRARTFDRKAEANTWAVVRLCCTNPARYSLSESSMIARRQEQLGTHEIQDHELIVIQ